MALERFKTGIDGFDQLSNGGLPKGRTTLITGSAGCGKTLFMLTAVVRGIIASGEPAVFLTFEERPEDLIANAASIGLDLQTLIDDGRLRIDFVATPRDSGTEIGLFTLDGLAIRIDAALKAASAKYLAIDTIETLFTMFENARTIRSELVRLLGRLSDAGITTIMTAERGDGQLTRRGFEDYISDCVIVLENDTDGDVATRRLRVLKYRGSYHGPNKYPFVIDSTGITIVPLSSALFNHRVSIDRLPTGTDAFDNALGGGLRRGSTTLFSGDSGSGKSILASLTVAANCERSEPTLFFSFEESPDELVENVRSAGIDLAPHLDTGRLEIVSARPTLMGLERHLVEIYRRVETASPTLVVIDPISSLSTAGDRDAVYRTIVRMIDYLKRNHVTALLTMEASKSSDRAVDRGIGFSSILDTLIELTYVIDDQGVSRYFQIIKARGIAHDHRKITFRIGPAGPVVEAFDD